jgi:hypothetical protein
MLAEFFLVSGRNSGCVHAPRGFTRSDFFARTQGGLFCEVYTPLQHALPRGSCGVGNVPHVLSVISRNTVVSILAMDEQDCTHLAKALR